MYGLEIMEEYIFFPGTEMGVDCTFSPGPRAYICKAAGNLGMETRHLGLSVTQL